MKYRSVDEAEHFNYHDACLKRTFREGTDWIMELEGVCVEPSNSQNTYLMAMQTDFLRMRFQNGRLNGGKFYDSVTRKPDGTEEWKQKEYRFTQEDLQEVLEHLHTEHDFWISHGGYVDADKERTTFFLDIDLQTCLKRIGTAFACLEISCTGIVMEWDGYCGLAWYEPRRKNIPEKGGTKNG